MNKLGIYKDILFSTLSEISSLIVAGKDKRKIFEKLLHCCLVVLEADWVHLLEVGDHKILRYTKSRADKWDRGARIEEIPETPALREWMLKETKDDDQFARGKELAFDVQALADHCLDAKGQGRVIISAPLMAKKSMFGLLVAIHTQDGGVYLAEDIKLITVLANQAAIALENAVLYQKIEKDAMTDGLTSVYNYRYLIQALDTEVKRAKRFNQVFCFVMLDVDNLKEYNDRLGHLGGSQALKEIAGLISSSCREIDLVTKYGGDEFGIILPQTDLNGALKVTRRVLNRVANHCFDGKNKGILTCSAGVSRFPRDGKTGREMIASADKALFQAKRSGKNTIVTTDSMISKISD